VGDGEFVCVGVGVGVGECEQLVNTADACAGLDRVTAARPAAATATAARTDNSGRTSAERQFMEILSTATFW
jgi:hypothetical protein